jgi:hypothetical protein
MSFNFFVSCNTFLPLLVCSSLIFDKALVYGLKRLPWCLVEFLPLKVPASCFDLELRFGCAKFDASNWRNLILKIIEKPL